MINMIKAELYRMSKTKAIWLFWILSALTYGISINYKVWGGITLGVFVEIPDSTMTDIGQLAMNFTFYFLLIMPVFCVITSEFTERTIKNTISSSVSKSRYFIFKFLFAAVYSTVSFALASYLYYIVNRLVNGTEYSSSIKDYSKAFFVQLPVIVGIISVFIFLAFLLRRGSAYNAVTISAPIVYNMLLQLLYSIESDKAFAEKIRHLGEKMFNYEISAMITKLAVGTSVSYRNNCYIISAAAIVFSFVLGYLSFTKRELE